MGQEHIWNLIAKKLSGEASEEELLELEKHLRSNADLHYPMQTITDLWHSEYLPDKMEAAEAFDDHVQRMKLLGIDFNSANEVKEGIKPQGRKRKIIFISAAIATILIAVFIFNKINSNPDLQISTLKNNSEVSTRNGSKTNLVLPDGTLVWLNAGSKLSYDKNYGNNLREVNLTGEAFFDVVKNAEKPFLIHTGKINIKVLGTSFNVKSYPSEKTIETSLIRGSIEVTFKDRPSEKVILKPNEKLVVANEENAVAHDKKQEAKTVNEPIVAISHLNHQKADSAIVETAWMQNKLIFHDKSFKELAEEMERWYGVIIKFDGSRRDTLHFTGSFENETIQQALDALKLTTGKSVPDFHYTIRGNEFTIIK